MSHRPIRFINLSVFFLWMIITSTGNTLATRHSDQERLPLTFVASMANESKAANNGLNYSVHLPLIVKNYINPVIPDTTKILSNKTTSSLRSVSEDGAIFTFSESSTELELLEPGEIIVGDTSDVAPNGFLRKVVNTSTVNEHVIVETTNATLEEAITQGEVIFNRTLKPSDVQASILASGVTFNKTPSTTENWAFEYDINQILYDHDGNLGTTYDQVRANGKVSLETDIDFRYKIGWKFWKGPKITFTQTTTELAKLQIVYESGYHLQKEVVLARHYLTPVTVSVGPFPVVFTPVLTIYVGVDGSVNTRVNTKVDQWASLTYGVQYNGGWSPIGDFNNAFEFTPPTLDANLNVKGYAGANAALLLYGVVGPQADLTPYLLVQANVNSAPWWKLYGGLAVSAGIKVDILGWTVSEYQARVIDHAVLLAQANMPPPTCYPLSISHTGMGSNPTAAPTKSASCPLGKYVAGEFIQLSGAQPDSGWKIDSWTNTNNDNSTASTNSLTMPAWAISVSVNYTEIPPTCYPLSISHTGMGSNPTAAPTKSASCPLGKYVAGEFIQLSGAQPESGWQIDSWTNTNNDNSTASTNSLTMPAWAISVSVNYTEIPPSSVTMDQVYITDCSGNIKTSFRQGEAICFGLIATNHSSSSVDVYYYWDTFDPDDNYVDYLSYYGYQVTMPPGESGWLLEREIASDAIYGTYTYTASVTFPAGSDSKTTIFEVQGGVTMDQVYTTDCSGNMRTSFRAGEDICLHFVATNHESYNIDVYYYWDTFDPYENHVDYLSYYGHGVSVSPGEDSWYLPGVIASNATSGTYSYTASVTFQSGSDSKTTTFDVSSSLRDVLPPDEAQQTLLKPYKLLTK